MIHLPIMCWLLVAVLFLGGLLIRLLRAIIREATFFATTETLAGVLGALVFIGVLLDAPCRGVC